MASGQEAVTALLIEWSNGNREALERLTPFVYQELRSLAGSYMRQERGDHTLQATALVHEVYLKLFDQRKMNWKSRSHFFGVAAKIMRRILVDHAKAVRAAKRGGGEKDEAIFEDRIPSMSPDRELIELDDALSRLEEFDARKGQVVELKFFGGMTTEEAAHYLDISVATVERDWRVAKAWLHREMQSSEDEV